MLRFSFAGGALHGIIPVCIQRGSAANQYREPDDPGLKGRVQVRKVLFFVLIAAVPLAVKWVRSHPAKKRENLLLAFNILLSLLSAAILLIIGFGVSVVYQGSVVLFGKLLYTVLAGAIMAGIVWGNVYSWRAWARKYHVRSMRRKTASRLHVVQGGKSGDAPAEDEKADAPDPRQDGE